MSKKVVGYKIPEGLTPQQKKAVAADIRNELAEMSPVERAVRNVKRNSKKLLDAKSKNRI